MRTLRWSAALVTTLAVAFLVSVTDHGVVARGRQRVAAERSGSVATLEVFTTSPVLVRTGEPVRLPVDVVCATTEGQACPATAVVSIRGSGGTWRTFRHASTPDLRFDLTAPLARATVRATGSGRLSFRVSAVAASGAVASLASSEGQAPTLHAYVTDDLPSVRIPSLPFGEARRGREVLYLPWGAGPLRAGLRPGNESPTLGPSSFDVGRDGSILLMDALQGRLAEFRSGRLVRRVRLPGAQWADVAAARDGTAFVASRTAGTPWRGTLRVVSPDGRVSTLTTSLPGMPSETTVRGVSPFVRVIPLDAWVSGPSAAGDPGRAITGRPLRRGGRLLVSGTDRRIRIGTVVGGRVRRAVELLPPARLRFGEVTLAEPDGRGGYTIVVHVRRTSGADRYQVVRLDRSLRVRSFLTPAGTYATAMPLARFRLGPQGSVYQMRTEPDGVHIVRYDDTGRATWNAR